jgi:lipopolysaccharide export LptBFGC system permease protein LptF
MLKINFSKLFFSFIVWSCAVSFIFVLMVLLNLPNNGNQQPILISTYLRYLTFNLPWIISLSLPISGLLATSDVYISGLLNKTASQSNFRGNTTISRLFSFLVPAATLGASIVMILFFDLAVIVPTANSRCAGLAIFMKTGAAPSNHLKSDREMGMRDLLKQVKLLSLESSQANQQQKMKIALKQKKIMVEVYKKVSIPLLGLLMPILGSIIALILSKLRSGQRVFLFLFDIILLIFIWLFIIAGESWGDRGSLSPFVSMFLTPACTLIIIVALLKRANEILASTEASL